MSEINSEQNYNQEEEISLIDLFAVLIRFRKMIVFGTILLSFIAAIFIVVIPKVKDMTVIYSIKVNQMPGSFRGRVFEGSGANSVGGYLTSNVNYLPFLAAEYKKFPFYAQDGKLPENQTEEQFNQMVSEFIAEGNGKSKIEIKSSIIADTYDLKVTIKPVNRDILDAFVKDVVQNVDENLIRIILPRVDSVQADLEASLKNLTSSFSTMNDAGSFQGLERSLQDIEKFKAEFAANPHFATLQENSFAYTVKKMGKIKGLGIAMFASLFIMIFLAFARNAIQNIKADPVASKTIRDAYESGK